MTGQLHILDHSGHRTIPYDPETENRDPKNGPVDPAFAAKEFDRLVSQGHLGFGTTAEGEHVQLKRFDDSFPKITLTPQFVGG